MRSWNDFVWEYLNRFLKKLIPNGEYLTKDYWNLVIWSFLIRFWWNLTYVTFQSVTIWKVPYENSEKFTPQISIEFCYFILTNFLMKSHIFLLKLGLYMKISYGNSAKIDTRWTIFHTAIFFQLGCLVISVPILMKSHMYHLNFVYKYEKLLMKISENQYYLLNTIFHTEVSLDYVYLVISHIFIFLEFDYFVIS